MSSIEDTSARKALNGLPEEAYAGQSIFLSTDKTHSMTGLYGVELRAGTANFLAVTRDQTEPVFFTLPRLIQPGTYEVRGKYPPGSSVEDPVWGTLSVVASPPVYEI